MGIFLEFKPKNDDMDIERIHRLQQKMEKRKASICSERAVLFTESFSATEGEDYVLRKAKAFAHVLKNMSIYIEDDSLIFGNQAARNFAAPIFPEYSFNWVIDELDEFEKRTGDIFYIDEKDKKELRKLQNYWSGQTHQDEVVRTTPERIVLSEKQGVLHRGGISMSGDGHIVPDHELILKKGFRGIINEAKEKLKTADNEEAEIFYNSVIITLEAALDFIKRYGRLAEEMAEKETDIKRKNELLEIGKMCRTLMEQPAQSFYEGCEICYLVHMLQMIESNGHSFCYGRFDQYMYELYKKDIENVIIDLKLRGI